MRFSGFRSRCAIPVCQSHAKHQLPHASSTCALISSPQRWQLLLITRPGGVESKVTQGSHDALALPWLKPRAHLLSCIALRSARDTSHTWPRLFRHRACTIPRFNRDGRTETVNVIKSHEHSRGDLGCLSLREMVGFYDAIHHRAWVCVLSRAGRGSRSAIGLCVSAAMSVAYRHRHHRPLGQSSSPVGECGSSAAPAADKVAA